ncbi:MAG: hypothetical protein GKR94_09680 [Gammaproteobacteria bacterium]|nr:hypothetical protein [Gammaproteobacteria bacterium]
MTTARGEIAFLADPVSLRIQRSARVYVGPNAPVLLYEKIDQCAQARLALTQTGLWIYLPFRAYSTKDSSVCNGESEHPILIMNREHTFEVGEGLSGKLSPGDCFRLQQEYGEFYAVEVNTDKFPELRAGWSEVVLVPKDKAEKPADDSGFNLADIDYITRGYFDGIYKFRKACGTEVVQKRSMKFIAGTGAGIGVDTKYLRANFGLSGDLGSEETSLQRYPSEQEVKRRIYTRRNRGAAMSLTKLTACGGSRRALTQYIYTDSQGETVYINKSWMDDFELRTHPHTQEAVVSCYPEYFKLYQALNQTRIDDDDIDFVIALVARWTDLRDFEKCAA